MILDKKQALSIAYKNSTMIDDLAALDIFLKGDDLLLAEVLCNK